MILYFPGTVGCPMEIISAYSVLVLHTQGEAGSAVPWTGEVFKSASSLYCLI